MPRRGFMPSGREKVLSAGDQKVLERARSHADAMEQRLAERIGAEKSALLSLLQDERAERVKERESLMNSIAGFGEAAARGDHKLELRVEALQAQVDALERRLERESIERKLEAAATITAWLRRVWFAARRIAALPVWGA